MILSETQAAIRDAVRAFAQERIAPRIRDFEAAGGFPPDLFKELAIVANPMLNGTTVRLDGAVRMGPR